MSEAIEAAVVEEPEDARGALTLLDAALTHRPTFPEAQLNRAAALRRIGEQQAAREILNKLASDPETPPAIRAQAQHAARTAD